MVMELVRAPASYSSYSLLGLGVEMSSSWEGRMFQASLYPSPVLLGKPGLESGRWLANSADC